MISQPNNICPSLQEVNLEHANALIGFKGDMYYKDKITIISLTLIMLDKEIILILVI